MVLGDLLYFKRLLDSSRKEIIFYTGSMPNRNATANQFKDFAKYMVGNWNEGFNAAFILSKRGVFNFSSLEFLSRRMVKLERDIGIKHEQAFINYCSVVCGLDVGAVRLLDKEKSPSWDVEAQVLKVGEEYFFNGQPGKPVRAFHFGGMYWGRGVNGPLLESFRIEKEEIEDTGDEKILSPVSSQYVSGKPDFICIGAQKAGTTWLHHNLSRHPQVWMPKVKELQYFNDLYVRGHSSWTRRHRSEHVARAIYAHASSVSRPEELDVRLISDLLHIAHPDISDEWYRSIFCAAPQNVVRGETTPEYSILPEDGIRHVLTINDRVKIIFMVRDPIERAWSHVRMLAHRQRLPAQSENILSMLTLPDITVRSDYEKIVNKWIPIVGDDNFLIVNYDDICRNPVYVMEKICNFIGVARDDAVLSSCREVIHAGEPMDIPVSAYEVLKANFYQMYQASHPVLSEMMGEWENRHFAN